MSSSPKAEPPTTTSIIRGATTEFSTVHPDIIEAHILTRLNGPALASLSCVSSTLHSLSTQDHLWFHICHCNWPSTVTPRVRHVISTYPEGGPRSFFSHSYPLPIMHPTSTSSNSNSAPPSELISAVDIHYQNELIFTKVHETETVTGWFRCSPFRIDMLEPKDVVSTPIEHPNGDDTCTALMDDMTLSWILIDPIGRRAVNLSSNKPVSVQRHWLSGEVQVRFASILASNNQKGSVSGFVQCEIVVTCSGSEGGEMQVSEVSLEVEDMDGKHLNGKDSLVILQRALEGKKGKGKNREEEGRKSQRKFLKMKKERKEKKLRREGTLDILCVVFGVTVFATFCFFIFGN
ncbi:unnamed protein product [Ilex paraguariensis]|uniref:F-box protein n=1 Tax=Ilex paraguariensis TaxID=185542 RepID=A0ABC8RBY9_9AQUA